MISLIFGQRHASGRMRWVEIVEQEGVIVRHASGQFGLVLEFGQPGRGNGIVGIFKISFRTPKHNGENFECMILNNTFFRPKHSFDAYNTFKNIRSSYKAQVGGKIDVNIHSFGIDIIISWVIA